MKRQELSSVARAHVRLSAGPDVCQTGAGLPCEEEGTCLAALLSCIRHLSFHFLCRSSGRSAPLLAPHSSRLTLPQTVAAVCHGPAALLLAKTPEGKSILDGIPVTGFSNSEEAQTPYNDFVNTLPFSLEDRLNKASGGKYQQGKDWTSFFVYGNGVLTGESMILMPPPTSNHLTCHRTDADAHVQGRTLSLQDHMPSAWWRSLRSRRGAMHLL